MINLDIPGWGNVDIEHILLDLNGTVATDGKIPLRVREKIQALSHHVDIYVLSADTQGTAREETVGMDVKLIVVKEKESAEEKLRFLQSLDPAKAVAIGNGKNDHLILKEAALGIAVLGDEGVSVSAITHADIVVKNVEDAFDLFLNSRRLIATLRE